MIHCFETSCRSRDPKTDTCRKADILIEEARCKSYQQGAEDNETPERDGEGENGGTGNDS